MQQTVITSKTLILKLSEYLKCRHKLLNSSDWNSLGDIYAGLVENTNLLGTAQCQESKIQTSNSLAYYAQRLRDLAENEMFIASEPDQMRRNLLLALIDLFHSQLKK